MEYPKMLYRDKEKKDYVIVSSREEQIEKQEEGYHEHDGTVIPASGVIEKNDAVEIAEPEPEVKAKPEETVGEQPKPEETGEDMKYKCGICGEGFKKKKLLKYHIFKRHPEVL